MSIFKKDKKSANPQFFEKIGFYIRWAEWLIKFISWIVAALRSFPPFPKMDSPETNETETA